MITALDSSVILDVLTGDAHFAESSEDALRKASAKGQLIICECVASEIYPALGSDEVFDQLLADWQLHLVASSLESAKLAGRNFQTYLNRGGREGRVAADFLIGAHAQIHADQLIARDRGYLRDYFKKLKVLDPSIS